MAKDDSLYPNYPGNPQRLDPDYSEGDDTIAGATDYNKHDDEILKHQDLIKNINTTTGSGGVTNHALLNNLDYASSAHTGFQASLSTGAGVAIVGTTINGTQDQNLFNVVDVESLDIIANSLTTELKIRTGAGVAISGNNNTKTITISAMSGNPQTPWLSNINGGGYSLTNVLGITSNSFTCNGVTSDPSSPTNGQFWCRSDVNEIRFRINGTTYKIVVSPVS